MALADILANYAPITLAEMGGIRLMNRTDTKFVTTLARLEVLLQEASQQYYAQQIDGERIARYYTMYFDTPEHAMLRSHITGHLNRQKLRIRSYVDSGLDFLEVKTKNNHCRTRKSRIAIDRFDSTNDHDANQYQLALTLGDEPEQYREFLGKHLRYDIDSMIPRIENRFNRVTLVNQGKTERLTIDTALEFHNLDNDSRLSLDNLAIIELKRDGLIASPILDMLRQLRIMPSGFSKYCMGMVMTSPHILHNRFKPRIRRVDKILVS